MCGITGTKYEIQLLCMNTSAANAQKLASDIEGQFRRNKASKVVFFAPCSIDRGG